MGSRTMNEEEFSVESLKRSKEIVGQLYPRLVNQNGKNLDGDHRFRVDENWEKKIVQTVDRADEILVRLHAHHRRKMTRDEMVALISELAQALEKRGVPREDISTNLCRILPYSERYIRELVPSEYKKSEKVEAAKVGAALAPQKPPTVFRCSVPSCGLGTMYPEYVDGQPVCSSCASKLHRGEISLEPPQPVAKPKVEEPSRVEEKFYEPPGAFKERMHQPISRMDEWVRNELHRRNVPALFQEPVCIKTVIPDVTIAQVGLKQLEHPIFVFLDHVDVHAKRSLVDMENRELLARKGLVLQLTYDAFTKEQQEEIMTKIMSHLGG